MTNNTEQNNNDEYPSTSNGYRTVDQIGRGAFGTVVSAEVLQGIHTKELVAIKILDLDFLGASWEIIEKEIKVMRLIDHPNVVRSLCSFVDQSELWLVMPLLDGGSCSEIMRQRFENGFENEELIASILKETLKGLHYLHEDGRIHRDIKAGNILLSHSGDVCIADFGVAGCLIDAGQNKGATKTFTGTPCWMAPEVMEQTSGHDYKADIWSFGITALELAYGKPPYAKHAPMKILMLTLQSEPPSTSTYGENSEKMSKSFRSVIDSCLKKDPLKRPSAKELLKNKFFKKAKGSEYIKSMLFSSIDMNKSQNMSVTSKIPTMRPTAKTTTQTLRKPVSVGAFDFDEEEEHKTKDDKNEDEEKTDKRGRFTVEFEDHS